MNDPSAGDVGELARILGLAADEFYNATASGGRAGPFTRALAKAALRAGYRKSLPTAEVVEPVWQPIENAPTEFQKEALARAQNLRLGDLTYQIMWWDQKGAYWAVVHFSNPSPARPIEYLLLPIHPTPTAPEK